MTDGTSGSDRFELTVGEMKQLIAADIKQMHAEIYRMQIRHRVQSKVNNKQEAKRLEEELEKLEIALDEYRSILKELETPA